MNNNLKNKFVFIVLVVLIITMIMILPKDKNNLLTSISKNNYNNYNLKIMAIDYGGNTFGDTVILESKGKYLLMDTGGFIFSKEDDHAKYLIDYLEKNNINNFDIYISHYDHDHRYNLKYLLDNKKFNIGTVYLPKIDRIREQCIDFEDRYKSYFESDYDNYFGLLNSICEISYGKGENASTEHNICDVDFDNNCSNLKKVDLGNDDVGGYLHNLHKNYPNIKVKYITKGDSIDIGKARLDVIWHSIPENIMEEYSKYDNYDYYEKAVGNYSNRFANNISLVSMVTAGRPLYAFYQIDNEDEDNSFITSSKIDDVVSKNLFVAQKYANSIFSTRYNGNVVFTLTDNDIYVEAERNYSKVKMFYMNNATGRKIREKEFIVNNAADSYIDKSLNGYDFLECNENTVRKIYKSNTVYTCMYKLKK